MRVLSLSQRLALGALLVIAVMTGWFLRGLV